MRKTLVVLMLLFLLATTAAAQGKSKSWHSGNWEGTGYQTDNNETWPMKLMITKTRSGRRTFSIDYPSLNCGGRWQLLSSNASRATFREVLDRGQNECTQNGRVVIQRVGRGQLLYLYSLYGTRELTASAILNRKKQTSKP